MSYDPNAPGQHPGPYPAQHQPQQPGPATHETTEHYQQQPAGQYPPQYATPQQMPGGGGPAFGVMTQHGRPGMHLYPFWQRSEFWTFLLTALAIGIAAQAADSFDAKGAWQLVAGLAAAYILSRGFAKREPREDRGDQPWSPDSGGSGRSGGRFGHPGGR